MSNRLTFFVMIFVIFQIMSFFIEGTAPLVTTFLTTAIAEDDASLTTVDVGSTAEFLSADFVTIGSEDICYSSITAMTFVISERGCRGTGLESHAIGTRVYNESTGMINQMIGFNILQVVADDGLLKGGYKALTALPQLAKSLIKMVIWDYSFMEAGAGLWLKYMLYCISAAIVLDFVLIILRRGGS